MAESQIKSVATGPSSPEKPIYSPEAPRQPEPYAETPQRLESAAIAVSPALARPASRPSVAIPSPIIQDQETLAKVEKILAENMDSVFLSMDTGLQLKFKQQGEETAQKIYGLLQKAKVKAQDIINLIVSWLRLISGVNRYYLEQEAKIKTDAILHSYKK